MTITNPSDWHAPNPGTEPGEPGHLRGVFPVPFSWEFVTVRSKPRLGPSVGLNVRDFLAGKRAGERRERQEILELVREMAKIERNVGETWETEARAQAPAADPQHLRNCAAIGYAHKQFAERLEDLATEIEARA